MRGANLSDSTLSFADLRGANLSEANLYKANLMGANLSEANLYKANLVSANLVFANLIETNLRFANLGRSNLVEADLSKADLCSADLRFAHLKGANLSDTKLRSTVGDEKYVISVQASDYSVTYTHDRLQIGCQNHSILDWWGFDDEMVESLDVDALVWWEVYKPLFMGLIAANPATKN